MYKSWNVLKCCSCVYYFYCSILCLLLIRDLPNVIDTPLTSSPILFIDTAGCGLLERETGTEESKGNEGEADLVLMQIKELLQSGVPPQEISIIAPYNLQVKILKHVLQNHTLHD